MENVGYLLVFKIYRWLYLPLVVVTGAGVGMILSAVIPEALGFMPLMIVIFAGGLIFTLGKSTVAGKNYLAISGETGEIVFGVVVGTTAGPYYLAVSHYDLKAGDVIGGDAVLEAMRAARVFGQVAAQGGRAPAGRVGRLVKPPALDHLV